MPHPAPRPEPGLQSVDRAITALQLLAGGGASTVTRLAAQMRVHKSTTSRLLATLERRGLVDRVEDGNAFVVGHGVALLAAGAGRPRSLTEASRSILMDVASEAGESASVNVLVDDDLSILTVEQAIGPSGLTGFNWLGQRSPAAATAAGKVLLATQPADVLAKRLRDLVVPHTEYTLTRAEFLAELVDVAASGTASCRDELELGLSAISAAVVDSTGVVAALSVSGPTARVFGPRHDDVARAVRDGAERLSLQLGSTPAVLPD
jgi:DNA-binding IclR family transcriptional regulator